MPRQIGRYALHEEIAAGGMAAVHLGRLLGSVGFARTVAIKRLHPQFAKDPAFVAMFLDEARLCARIRHPNVVPTLDVVSLDDELFLVMEYVHGDSLARLVKTAHDRGEAVPIELSVGVMIHALHGLHAAHEATSERGTPLEIVHRDVSPQNVLVGTDGVARVLDFGIAKATSRLQVTEEGQLKGKLAYMAPEQLERDDVDRRVDVWAASVVLWELLVGRRLFTGDHAARVMASVLKAEIDPPSRWAADVPIELDDIVMRGLSRDREARFDTARDMAIALEATKLAAPQHAIGAWVERMAGDSLGRRGLAEIEAAVLTSPDALPREEPTLANTERDVQPPKPRRRWALAASLAVVALGGMVVVATRSPPTIATQSASIVPSIEAPPTPTPTPSPSPSPTPSVSAPQPPKPKPVVAKPKPNCSPPYKVGKDGVKVPKLECL